jgi:hypothetical protein
LFAAPSTGFATQRQCVGDITQRRCVFWLARILSVANLAGFCARTELLESHGGRVRYEPRIRAGLTRIPE